MTEKIKLTPDDIRHVDNMGRICIPKTFLTAAGNVLTYDIIPEGIVLSRARVVGKRILRIEGQNRLYLPRLALRVFGNPLKMQVSYINGKLDQLLLAPIESTCVKCGKLTNLHSVYLKEIFVCTDCLNKAFDLHIPLDYADDSI